MDNNISLSKIHLTPEFSLAIKSLDLEDAGIYRCHGKEGQESENKFNYRLERKFLFFIFSFIFQILIKLITDFETPSCL